MAERIAVLGTGRMGTGLARLCARSGHPVCVGSRSRERAQETVEEIRTQYPDATVHAGDYRGAVQASDQVLPYIEQRAAGATRGVSGRIGSLAVDPSDPS